MKKFSYSAVSLAPLWGWGAALMLSFCWLLPNNARPWSAFHSDAWAACILALTSLAVLLKSKDDIRIQLAPLVVLAASMLPLIQYGAGVLAFSGQAWISSAYLLGFALAILTGQQWQRLNPLWMERVLFCAFLFAGGISVFLAIHQWLQLGASAGLFDIWILYYPPDRGRPYANLGQPNQLATLLVWALVGCAWAVHRGYLRVVGGVSLAGFLVIGLALTQSRSGMVGVLILLTACAVWRRLVRSRAFFYCVFGLLLWYVFLLLTLPYLGQTLLLDTEISFVERSTRESRPYMWRMLLDAATLHPWTGYGWNQVLPAQVAMAETYTRLSGTYVAQSHNLFLDFLVWTGFPTGLLLTGAILAWSWKALTKTRDPSQVFYLAALGVIGAHALVELPVHYAYFLLPAGLMAGALNASKDIARWGVLSRRIVIGFWLAVATLLGLIIYDYFRLEGAYNELRFKHANFVKAQDAEIPKTLVLNHLEYAIELYALTPVAGLAPDTVQRAVDTTRFLPHAHNIGKLVVILALNGRADDARFWKAKSQYMMSPANYLAVQEDWKRAVQMFPQIAATMAPNN